MTVRWHHVLLDSSRPTPRPGGQALPHRAAGVCPGRSAGRLPGSQDLPRQLPTLSRADAQVSGEIYFRGRSRTDDNVITFSRARARDRSMSKDEAAVLAASAHLTDRDRDLVRLVAVHRVLATDQLAAIGFGNITTDRHRLSALVRLGMLRRFRPRPPTGSAPWHYVLGPVGAAMLGVEDRGEKRWLPHVRVDRQLALECSPRLSHVTGRNWFFVALTRHAREHGGELREWLNEADTAACYENAVIRQDDRARLPHPDGGRHLGRERPDNLVPAGIRHRTEHLPVLADKLEGYQVVAAGASLARAGLPGPAVLFGSPRREQAARRALAATREAAGLRIATTAIDPRVTSPGPGRSGCRSAT